MLVNERLSIHINVVMERKGDKGDTNKGEGKKHSQMLVPCPFWTIWLSSLCHLITPLLPVPIALERVLVRRLCELPITCNLVDAFICCLLKHLQGTRIQKEKSA